MRRHAHTLVAYGFAFFISTAGCGGGGGGGGGGSQSPPPQPDFAIALSSSAVSVIDGATSAPISVSVTSTANFTGSVAVTLTGPPGSPPIQAAHSPSPPGRAHLLSLARLLSPPPVNSTSPPPAAAAPFHIRQPSRSSFKPAFHQTSRALPTFATIPSRRWIILLANPTAVTSSTIPLASNYLSPTTP
jgi:hypothetical protein